MMTATDDVTNGQTLAFGTPWELLHVNINFGKQRMTEYPKAIKLNLLEFRES